LGYDLEEVPDDVPLGFKISSKRRRLRLSRKALVELVGIDNGTVRRWERGQIFLRADERVRRILESWIDSCL